MVHKALEWGVNFFDTAPNYGLGTSESRLGKVLKGYDRSKIVVNTKFGHTASGDTNYSSNYIRKSLEGSLKRLQMDYVDSLIIHNPPFENLDRRAFSSSSFMSLCYILSTYIRTRQPYHTSDFLLHTLPPCRETCFTSCTDLL